MKFSYQALDQQLTSNVLLKPILARNPILHFPEDYYSRNNAAQVS